MKNSIAKKISISVLILLFVAMIFLLIGAYHVVSRVISNENQKYAQTVMNIYVDLLNDNSLQSGIPIDLEHTDEVTRYGEYICTWYSVDAVFLYELDVENESALCVASAFSKDQEPMSSLTAGKRFYRTPHPEELAVWNGEKEIGSFAWKSKGSTEISVIRLVEDCSGNTLIAGLDVSYDNINRQIVSEFLILSVIILGVLIGIYWAVRLIIRKLVSAPAQILSRRMQEYITDGKRSEEKLEVKGSDEYAMIAAAFNSMSDNIDSYVKNIHALTLEQANRQTELEIAAGIQRGFLPKKQMKSEKCNIRAMMVPARDVGGDLYDYIELDDDRFLIVIADVSGKGVSAAIFMAVLLMLIRQYAKMGLLPDGILRKTNDTLSENNAELLFATAFVGIFDSRTQQFTYSNAGHNLPYVLGKDLQKLDGEAGTILGIFQNEEYHNHTVQLSPGNVIFLYTDGITEAVNSNRSFFGEQRLEKTLHSFRSSSEDDVVAFVYDSVCRFADGAEQFDDITMLALTARQTVKLSLDFDVREFEKLKNELLQISAPRSQQLELCLAAEEIFVNICSYAFDGKAPENEKIEVTLSVSDCVKLRFVDHGMQYDPLEKINAAPDDEEDDIPIGGLGKLLYTSLSDKVEYEYRDGKNILTLVDYYEEEDK